MRDSLPAAPLPSVRRGEDATTAPRTTHLEWVDRAKGVGIVLVVFGHVADGVYRAGIAFPPATFKLVYDALYSFHMPLFFLLAGLFFYSSWLKRGTGHLILAKLDTIAYPYILWSLVQGSIEVAASRYTNHHTSFSSVLTLFWHPRQQFWFLYALFLEFVLACLVYAVVPRKWQGAVVVLAASAFVLRSFGPHTGPVYYLAAESVFFFIGVALSDRLQRPYRRTVNSLLLAGAAFIAVQVGYAICIGTLTPASQGLVDLAVALVSIAFVIALSRALRGSFARWFAVLGQQSLAIYLMHTLFASGTRIALLRLLGVERLDVHLIAGTAAGIVIPLLLARFIEARHIQGVFSIPSRWRPAAESSTSRLAG